MDATGLDGRFRKGPCQQTVKENNNERVNGSDKTRKTEGSEDKDIRNC